MHRIHIVGIGPRTGTTLLAEAMIACFEIDLYNEHEAEIWSWPPRPAQIFLTKHPRDILVADAALRIFGNCHIICMLRDPRDMIVSRHGARPDKYWAGLDFWKFRAPIARALLGHPRFITVQYDELTERPDEVQDELMRRMPFLKKKCDFSRYHENSDASEESVLAMHSIRPITPGSRGNWRRHKPRVAGQLSLHGPISDDLIEFGFEKDASWERELEGVAPDLAPSFWPEDQQPAWLRRHARFKHVKALGLVIGHLDSLLPATTRARRAWRRIRAALQRMRENRPA